MQLVGADVAQALADASRTSTKVVFSGAGAIFFPVHEQHRDQRAPGIFYVDDYRGNALAATLDNRQIEVRYHDAYSDAQVANLLTALAQHPELKFLRDWHLKYQGRDVAWSS